MTRVLLYAIIIGVVYYFIAKFRKQSLRNGHRYAKPQQNTKQTRARAEHDKVETLVKDPVSGEYHVKQK